jgi:hypothetical protein
MGGYFFAARDLDTDAWSCRARATRMDVCHNTARWSIKGASSFASRDPNTDALSCRARCQLLVVSSVGPASQGCDLVPAGALRALRGLQSSGVLPTDGGLISQDTLFPSVVLFVIAHAFLTVLCACSRRACSGWMSLTDWPAPIRCSTVSSSRVFLLRACVGCLGAGPFREAGEALRHSEFLTLGDALLPFGLLLRHVARSSRMVVSSPVARILSLCLSALRWPTVSPCVSLYSIDQWSAAIRWCPHLGWPTVPNWASCPVWCALLCWIC